VFYFFIDDIQQIMAKSYLYNATLESKSGTKKNSPGQKLKNIPGGPTKTKPT
jgi:hypothetical protein